jgi:hypothetical protein
MTLTGIKVGHIRADGAGKFARSATFKAYCRRHNIVIEEVPAYIHTFNARAEGAIRICKDKVRALLRRANMPRRFWPDALLHWCRTYAHWPDASGHTRGKSWTNWGRTPSVMILNERGMSLAPMSQAICHWSTLTLPILLKMIAQRRVYFSAMT